MQRLIWATPLSILVGVCALGGAAAQSVEPYGPQAANPVKVDEDLANYSRPAGVPVVLADAVLIASRSHPLVRQARSEQSVSEAELRGARWQRFPSVSLEGLAVAGGNDFGVQNGLATNLVVDQPLYTFGRIAGTIEGAQYAVSSRAYAVLEAQIDISLRTVNAFFDLALATRREQVLEKSLREHEDLLATMSRRVDQEVSPQADLELAISRTAQIEQDLAAAAGLRTTSFSRLQELVGYVPLELGSVPEFDAAKILPTEQELVASALECSPRLKRLQALRGENEARRRVTRSRLFPQLSAQASANEITGTRAGLTLRLQTGNGLSQFSAVEAVDAQIVSTEFELASSEREIREQIRVDYLTYVAGLNRLMATQRATGSSENVTDSYKRQFITGRRGWLDVMNAVRESMSANLTEAEASIGTYAAYSRIMLRACLWSPAPLTEDEN